MTQELVDAIRDMTRVMVALSGKFDTTADAVRTLCQLTIPPPRVAAIMGIDSKDVYSILARAKKAPTAKNGKRGSRGRA